jgi:hypothetical protein
MNYFRFIIYFVILLTSTSIFSATTNPPTLVHLVEPLNQNTKTLVHRAEPLHQDV